MVSDGVWVGGVGKMSLLVLGVVLCLCWLEKCVGVCG